ncbi:MAG: TlpA family protein disulfide reductase [Actinobacteria bacterium]|nr:TlpA family protein disulfide reductase [Actinomycetota bacterium]
MIARTIVAGAAVAMLLSSCAAGPPAPTGSRTQDDAGSTSPDRARSTSADRAGSTSTPRARPANDFSVKTFDGDSFSLAHNRGSPVVLNFWESWCPVCQAEQPHLNQLAEDYAGKVAFIGVSNNDTVADGKAYAEQFDVPYPLGHAPEVWSQFDVPYQPVTLVLDGSGEIVARVDGPVTQEGLRRLIEKAL